MKRLSIYLLAHNQAPSSLVPGSPVDSSRTSCPSSASPTRALNAPSLPQVVLVAGHYLSYLPLCSRNEPVFLAHCTPVAMPETRESVVQGATNVFTSVHTLDMKFINLDKK